MASIGRTSRARNTDHKGYQEAHVPHWQMNQPSKNRVPAFVGESADKVISIENEAVQPRSNSELISDVYAGFVGTISFVIFQLAAFAAWVVIYMGKIPGIAPFDPFPYPLLSSMTSLEAVLIAAFVLMKQNRMGTIAGRRDHLDLQVNLLTERRATQIIRMLDRLSTSRVRKNSVIS